MRLARGRREGGVREVGWAEFGELARGLTERIRAAYPAEVVLAVVNGGVFLGGALAAALRAELHPVRTWKRRQRVLVERLPEVRGRAVLVVDDVTVSGRTLAAVCGAALRAGAREVRTATLVRRPDRNRPDWHALETRDVVVFGWDYQLQGGGGAAGSDPGEVGV